MSFGTPEVPVVAPGLALSHLLARIPHGATRRRSIMTLRCVAGPSVLMYLIRPPGRLRLILPESP